MKNLASLVPRYRDVLAVAGLVAIGVIGCRPTGAPPTEQAETVNRHRLASTAASLFGALPAEAASPDNPLARAKIDLGRRLYFDKRLSASEDISCNTCHDLRAYGIDPRTVDGQRTPTSMGHNGQMGGRNSPSVYNAAFHVAQFWDGRAADVEEQAIGPVMNPVEMAMPDDESVVKVLKAIPGYVAAFQAAFPGERDPVTANNLAKAIGAFERRLVTPAPFDRFVGGDLDALTEQQLRGLETFVNAGCVACHGGPTFGGKIFQKLGLVRSFPTKDVGRFDVTREEADRHVFKVPSLRNIAKTGPYLHDGSVEGLASAIEIMTTYQTGKPLSDTQVADIAAFLEGALTGMPDPAYIAEPELPPKS